MKKLVNKLIKERGDDANLNDINTSKITDMSKLFLGLNHIILIHNIDISEWNVSNVKDMTLMFYKCEKFNCYLGNWDVSNVMRTTSMFSGCKKFTGKGLENWNVSKCTNMNWMFDECEKFYCDLNNWNISNTTDTYWMFNACGSLINKPSWYKK